MRLYYASSTIDNFRGCDKVHVAWFHSGEHQPPAPYEQLVEGWGDMDDPSRAYAQSAVEDLFTADETEALRSHLKEYGTALNIEKAELPLPSEIMGCGAIPVGGPQGFLELHRGEGYPLPFEVAGYYDLRHALRKFVPPTLDPDPGVRFVGALFHVLKLPTAEQASIKSALGRIKDEAGLFVMQGFSKEKTFEEWKKEVAEFEEFHKHINPPTIVCIPAPR